MLCRRCYQPADSARYEFANELVAFIYSHKRDGEAPTEHRFNVFAIDARELIAEDKVQQ